jgi:hypothetical protein
MRYDAALVFKIDCKALPVRLYRTFLHLFAHMRASLIGRSIAAAVAEMEPCIARLRAKMLGLLLYRASRPAYAALCGADMIVLPPSQRARMRARKRQPGALSAQRSPY